MRRKRKWPFFLSGFVCVIAIGCVGLRTYKKRTLPPPPCAYHPKTWSSFTEYQRLEMLLKGFAIESVLDVPSVDHESLKKGLFSHIHYIGITNSKDRARALQVQLGSKIRTFLDREITIDMLPKVDLILCWDMLCTMTPREIEAAMLQFKKSGAKFLLMRHFPEVKKNKKNKTGNFQPVNWMLPPYNFPEPIIHIMEKGEHGMESLALWNIENL